MGENVLTQTVPSRFSTYAGLDVGKDNGDPVSLSYAAKSPFAPLLTSAARAVAMLSSVSLAP